MKVFIGIVVTVFLIAGSLYSQEEKISITTYYPAPYGAYNQLEFPQNFLTRKLQKIQNAKIKMQNDKSKFKIFKELNIFNDF